MSSCPSTSQPRRLPSPSFHPALFRALKYESPFFFVSSTNSAQRLSARVAPRSSYHSSLFLFFVERVASSSGCPPSPTSGIGRWSHLRQQARKRVHIRAPTAMCKLELKSPLVRRVLGLGGVGSGWRQKFTLMCSSPEVLTASATNYCIHTSGSRSNACGYVLSTRPHM